MERAGKKLQMSDLLEKCLSGAVSTTDHQKPKNSISEIDQLLKFGATALFAPQYAEMDIAQIVDGTFQGGEFQDWKGRDKSKQQVEEKQEERLQLGETDFWAAIMPPPDKS